MVNTRHVDIPSDTVKELGWVEDRGACWGISFHSEEWNGMGLLLPA